MTIIHDEESAAHGKLAQRLNITSQALTWHMKQLKEQGIVTDQAIGLTINYALDESYLATVKQCFKVTTK